MPDDQHITREILRALDRGELALHDLYRLARHLTSLCPTCRSAVQSYRKEEAGPALSDRVAAVVERASRLSSRSQTETGRAHRLLERLRHLAPEERILRLEAEVPPPGAPFIEELLAEERSCRTEDPFRALAWTELALHALDLVEEALPSQWVLVHTAYANALRATGALSEAQGALARTRELAEKLHADEPHVTAELDMAEGTLDSDLRRFARAEEHLRRAARTFEQLGSPAGAAEAYIKLASLQTYANDLPSALETIRAAVQSVSPEEFPRLYLYARLNTAHMLAIAEEYQQAFDLLEWDEDLYRRHADRHLELRYTWLQGRIAAATGHPHTAEHHFLTVRDAFADLGIAFDVALVSLDLALLYHQEGRLEDLKHAAIEAVHLFQQYGVHREALAALTMLRDASLDEHLTAATIEQIADFVRTAARDPQARFARPN